MVILVFLLQTTQNGDGALLIGLVDHDNLEPALERLVLLEIFLILVERGGPDAAQLATRQSRLENIGRIHGTAALAGTHQRVNLVDEQDDLAAGLRDFIDDSLEPFLKFSLIHGPGDECAHVERVDLLHLQVFGHVAAHDSLGKPLDNGGLSRTGLADEDGVVFGASAQDLQHTPDFIVTPDDRVEFSLTRTLIEVDGIFAQRMVLLLGFLAGGFLALAQLPDGFLEVFLGETGIF